jgi:hypothetical protein
VVPLQCVVLANNTCSLYISAVLVVLVNKKCSLYISAVLVVLVVLLSSAMLCQQVKLCAGEGVVTVRISDQGGGIPQHHLNDVWTYGWSSVDWDKDWATHRCGSIATSSFQVHTLKRMGSFQVHALQQMGSF